MKTKSGKTGRALKSTQAMSSRPGGSQYNHETQDAFAAATYRKSRTRPEMKSRSTLSGTGGDRVPDETHLSAVPAKKSPRTKKPLNPVTRVSESAGSSHTRSEAQQFTAAAGSSLDELLELWRWRQDVHMAEKKLTLQAKSILRRFTAGDKDAANELYTEIAKGAGEQRPTLAITPILAAKEPLIEERKKLEKRLEQIVVMLPIWNWAKTVRGLGPISLASLLGETGDLANYANPAKVWKRMGLAVFNGESQRRVTGDAAIEQGYSPIRRSIAWNIGECVIKAQWRKEGGALGNAGKLYGEYKARISAANEAGTYAETATRIVTRMKKAGKKPLPENVAGRLTPGHINNRAKRYMTKKLIAQIWGEWNAKQLPLQEAAE